MRIYVALHLGVAKNRRLPRRRASAQSSQHDQKFRRGCACRRVVLRALSGRFARTVLRGSSSGRRRSFSEARRGPPPRKLRESSSEIRRDDSAHFARHDGAPPHPRSSAQNWPLLEAPSPPPPAAISSTGQRGSLVASTAARHARSGQMAIHPLTVWPSGLRRWLQAPVRKGVGSNPTAVTCCPRHAAARAGARSTSPCNDAAAFAPWRDVPSRGRNQHGKACSVTACLFAFSICRARLGCV